MSLADLLKVVASGEPVEVFDVESKTCENPYISNFFEDWMQWDVIYFYSIWNESKKETKTHIEVKRV